MNNIEVDFFHDLETRNNLLRISVNDKVIYNKENRVYCSPDCYEGLKLPYYNYIWIDRQDYDKEINNAVSEYLSDYEPHLKRQQFYKKQNKINKNENFYKDMF